MFLEHKFNILLNGGNKKPTVVLRKLFSWLVVLKRFKILKRGNCNTVSAYLDT